MSDYNHSSRQLLNHTEKMFFGIFIFVVALFQMTVAQASDITPATILDLVNAERSKIGLNPLTENVALSNAAEDKLNDMFQNDYFSHTSPKGETPWHWIKRSGYAYQYAGENLAINYSNAEKQHQAWMKSETHRANILSSKFTETGIAVRNGKLNGEEAVITVEMFGAPRFTVAKTKNTQEHSSQVQGMQSDQSIVTIPGQAIIIPFKNGEDRNLVTNEFIHNRSILTTDEYSQAKSSFTFTQKLSNWLLIGSFFTLVAIAVILPIIFVGQMTRFLFFSHTEPSH